MIQSSRLLEFMRLVLLLNLIGYSVWAGDTFTPYRANKEVPRNVVDLWEAYDARLEPLEVRWIREWKSKGVITRYLTFKVGTFKGVDARIAAYYSFPEKGRRHAAFVWSHGGGQRAERRRGIYFAEQGFATVDINWLGRRMEEGIETNTDWGKVDPTQGPRFYPKALREGWKRNLQPDDHSIDPVPSPRNANWFLLAVAARRAITFLEQQPEVDPERIGCSGYSMGGMITALVAIDPRLKAVAPFVGGTGFKDVDFPGGIQGSSLREHFLDRDLYRSTIDASAYWPRVTCPVLFVTSSNDFHSTFERIYQSMALLPHQDWRVTSNIHQNHGPGPEQWAVLNLWFDEYLKGRGQAIPSKPSSTLERTGEGARFMVTPAESEGLVATEIYYSHDPNSRTRFWHRARAGRSNESWEARLPVHDNLPLYVFALCRYRLPEAIRLERGETSTVTINSVEHMIIPDAVDLSALAGMAKTRRIFEDFEKGIQDWSSRDSRSLQTYKFQSPDLDRSNDQRLALTLDPQGRRLSVRLKASSRFLSRENNRGNFLFMKAVEGSGPRVLKVSLDEFESDEGKALEWSKIAVFEVSIVDEGTNAKIDLTSRAGWQILSRIELVAGP